MNEVIVYEAEWIVGPSWVNLEKKLQELAGKHNVQIQITGKEMSLMCQRLDYKISGPRQNLKLFNKKLLGEGHVKFIGVG
jgi:hypothetical protein